MITQYGDLRGLLTTGFSPSPGANVIGEKSFGNHFDPEGTDLHGCPDDGNNHHAGDLGIFF